VVSDSRPPSVAFGEEQKVPSEDTPVAPELPITTLPPPPSPDFKQKYSVEMAEIKSTLENIRVRLFRSSTD
jgi:hypothetical protein